MRQVLINTRAVGYKGQDKTRVSFTFHIETRTNDFAVDLLGDTVDVVIFDTFDVQGLDVLASNFEREGLESNDAKAITLRHLKGLVKDYLLTFNEYQRQQVGCIVTGI